METNYITVRNNCRAAKIHCALSWGTFQQDFRNDIPANGGYVEFELHDIGQHDLTIIMATTANRFSPNNNGKSVLLDMVVEVGKAALQGQLAQFAADHNDVKVVDGVQLRAYPVVITGLVTTHGNDITVTGGDIRFNQTVITGLDQLRAHWSNRMSPRNEQDYVAGT